LIAGARAGLFLNIALEALPGPFRPGRQWSGTMKRVATLAFYAVGALAIAYLALYAYAMFRGQPFVPGDPIHIFRKPDAPSYS
jgi:hypothetical protein